MLTGGFLAGGGGGPGCTGGGGVYTVGTTTGVGVVGVTWTVAALTRTPTTRRTPAARSVAR